MPGDNYRWAERILILIVGICLGILGWSFSSWLFDPKITLGEVFGAAITILLAWIVSILIERSKSTNTVLCGLMLARVEELRVIFREAHKLAHEQAGEVWSKATADKIVEVVRSASLLLNDAEELSLASYRTNHFEPIKQRYFNFKTLVTNTGKSNPLTPDKLIEIESLYKEIRCELNKIIVRACK